MQRRLFSLLAIPLVLFAQCAPDGCAPGPEPYIEQGTIEIPRLGLSRTLLEGISLATLDIAPGHWPGTAMPGNPGNVVVAGHRVDHHRDFRNIDQLARGDEVIFHTSAGRFRYVVTGTSIVSGAALWVVNQTPASTGTLIACHPPGSTRSRIVVKLAYSP